MASVDREILHFLSQRERERREKDGNPFLYGFNGWMDTPLLKPEREIGERKMEISSYMASTEG